ncbi:MAG: alpha/beta fold hydrolase, partial [Alphaproteobacteria bacterium]
LHIRVAAIRSCWHLLPAVAWAVATAGAWPHASHAQPLLAEVWADADMALAGETVTFASSDPFSLHDAAAGTALPRDVQATLFVPDEAGAARPVPAVVLLHGAGGVQAVRETTYARQLAAQGIAALVLDVFGNRRDVATGFTARVLNITEAMFLADAYGALRYLDARADVDGERVALVGFSYGGMATVYAVYAQVAEIFAPGGPRFAGHAAYYAPCIAEFERVQTTGAPVLMMWGTADAIVDPDRCAETIADLRAGGSAVEAIAFDGAFHQWDGGFATPRTIGRDLSPCALRVAADATTRDVRLGLEMNGPLTRRAILATCVRNEPYMIGADDAVRAQSTAALSRFLNATFALPQ